MSILTAILSNSGRVTLNIPRIQRGSIERWCKEQGEAIFLGDQLAIDRHHRTCSPLSIAGTRYSSPGLGDGIDPAFRADRRSQWRSVVEPAAPVPLSVPCLAVERRAQDGGMRLPFYRARLVMAPSSDRNERRQRGMQEPAEPNAFASSLFTHAIETIVPVPAANQRQRVATHLEGRVEGARAMFVQAGRDFGCAGLKKPFRFARIEHWPAEKGYADIQDVIIAGR